jgi:hypothetical protein
LRALIDLSSVIMAQLNGTLQPNCTLLYLCIIYGAYAQDVLDSLI